VIELRIKDIIKMIQGLELKQKEKEEKFMKERLEQEREKLLQEELEKVEKERSFKRGRKAIKASGILDAYDWLIEDLMKHGKPKLKVNGDLLEYAAFML